MEFSTLSYDAVSGIDDGTNLTTAQTYLWAEKSEAQKVIEIIFLVLLSVVGSLGNLIVIFSIMLEKRIHAHGNIFVVNLAFADLLVTGFVVPTVVVNVSMGENGLPHAACILAGYTVTVTCTCSLCNLMLIAVNRFYAVVRQRDYMEAFTRKRVYMMIFGTWIWSNLISLPTFFGWGRIAYDPKIELCTWDDTFNQSYTIFLTTLAVLFPLVVIFACYGKLFCAVRNSGRWVVSTSIKKGVGVQTEQTRRVARKERNLLKTLATTVAFFCICWLPYGFAIIIDAKNIPAIPKKIFGWLGLSNSAVNFVIYGVMNPVFRRGYKNLLVLLFLCKKKSKFNDGLRRASTHSDSFFKSGRRKRSFPSNSNPHQQKKGAHIRSNSNDFLKQAGSVSDSSLPKSLTSLSNQKHYMNGQIEDGNLKVSMLTPSSRKSSVPESVNIYKRSGSILNEDKKELKDLWNKICQCQDQVKNVSDAENWKMQICRTYSDSRRKKIFSLLSRNQSACDVTMRSRKQQKHATQFTNNNVTEDDKKKPLPFINYNTEIMSKTPTSDSFTDSECFTTNLIVNDDVMHHYASVNEGLHMTTKNVMAITIPDAQDKKLEISKL